MLLKDAFHSYTWYGDRCFVKRCTGTKHSLFIRGMLRTCNSLQRSKSDVYVKCIAALVFKQIYLLVLIFVSLFYSFQ
jgi:hypothetical protein